MARARSALIATGVLVATLTAHSWASGQLPDALPLALAALLATALGSAIGERRRAPASLIALAFGSQVALHLVLAVGGHGHGALLPGPAMLAAHAAAALLIAGLALEADRVITALRRLLASMAPALPALPSPAAPVLVPTLAHPIVPARDRTWSRRGPPTCS